MYDDITVDEGSSLLYQFRLKDEAGVGQTKEDLTALTLTVYDVDSGAIINSRDDVNLLIADAFTFTETDGLFSVRLAGEDNPVVTDSRSVEYHAMELCATLENGTTRNWQRVIKVCNLRHV